MKTLLIGITATLLFASILDVFGQGPPNHILVPSNWVGLGWTLNCGGAVSRSVVGKCDKGGFAMLLCDVNQFSRISASKNIQC